MSARHLKYSSVEKYLISLVVKIRLLCDLISSLIFLRLVCHVCGDTFRKISAKMVEGSAVLKSKKLRPIFFLSFRWSRVSS